MKLEVFFFIVFICTICYSIDITKLQKIPQPMKGFQEKLILGRWFFQFRKPPCNWPGSDQLSDFELTISNKDKKRLLFTNFARNDGLCTMFPSNAYKGTTPGTYLVKDPLGDKFSGYMVIPATDYKTFLVGYVCIKMSTFGDKCDDVLIAVRTRMVHPDKAVVARINFVLMHLWGITVDELLATPNNLDTESKKFAIAEEFMVMWVELLVIQIYSKRI
ncbi:hypothetical protein ACF0H5_008981 [Mactra antiquata]